VRDLRDALAVAGYRAGWAGVRRLPEPAAYALFDRAADLMWRGGGASVRQLSANLRRVRPSLDDPGLRELTRAGLRSYLRYWCDAFRLPDWDRDRVVSRFTCRHEERLRNNLAAGRGVVAALPHMANWDHAGAWAALTGAPVTTVAERLRPEGLYARFVAYRESLGIEVLPLTGAGDVSRPLARRLREGRLVPLLADRDLRASGVTVSFFGEQTRMPPGPALLALQTGAALVPVTMGYRGAAPAHGIELTWHPEVAVPTGGTTREKVAAMTHDVAAAFAGGIAADPQDWHMLQPLWVADLAAERDLNRARPR
jgi:phosphatidylinositol dimannoside acyltransferase